MDWINVSITADVFIWCMFAYFYVSAFFSLHVLKFVGGWVGGCCFCINFSFRTCTKNVFFFFFFFFFFLFECRGGDVHDLICVWETKRSFDCHFEKYCLNFTKAKIKLGISWVLKMKMNIFFETSLFSNGDSKKTKKNTSSRFQENCWNLKKTALNLNKKSTEQEIFW